MLARVVALDDRRVRDALRKLTGAALLTARVKDYTYAVRHALLAEAVIANLLPGELVPLHARIAEALESTGDPVLSAEVAGHWAAAGRPDDELRSSVAAARAATEILAFGTAADLWQRAIVLHERHPDSPAAAKVDPAQLHVDAIDALSVSGGRRDEAGRLAETAYARFADWPDHRLAALVRLRVARYRQLDEPSAARPLVEEALRLFDDAPASAEHAETLLAVAALHDSEGHLERADGALVKGLQIATLARATAAKVRLLAWAAHLDLWRGNVDQGLDRLREGQALAAGIEDADPALTVAGWHSDALLKLARLPEAIEVAQEAVDRAERGGHGRASSTAIVRGNGAEAMLDLGRTAAAGGVLDPLTQAAPQVDDWVLHVGRAAVDLRRGLIDEAAERLEAVRRLPLKGNPEFEREIAERAAEVTLWARAPERCLTAVRRALDRCAGTQQEPFCADLLVYGMRAAADLGGAGPAAAEIVALRDRMESRPFADHPFVARIPAHRLAWQAECDRLRGDDDPEAWRQLAHAWLGLGCRHRAGYAWWRCAEALAYRTRPAAATEPLAAAAECATGMTPLSRAIERLARRARIVLPPETARDEPRRADRPAAETTVLTRLTERERQVLRLVASGRTNSQIGGELFISAKTAGVHVTNILRKLEVTNRTHAAAVAERSGLLDQSDGA